MNELIPGAVAGPQDGGNFEASWYGDYLQAHLLTDIGLRRQKNEDSCLMCAPKNPVLIDERGLFFSVADGMGGASAGEFASRMSLRALHSAYYTGPRQSIPIALQEALEDANQQVFEEAEINPDYAGMGTTVSAVLIDGGWAYIAQVGDSRVYLLRERSGIHQITEDHSLVAEQVRNGIISEAEAENSSFKNLITRAVGIKAEVDVDLFAVRLVQGDTLLICSDGLCNMVSDPDIADCLSDGDLKLGTRKVVDLALANGGTDNVTAVTIRVVNTPPRSPIQSGAREVSIPSEGLFRRIWSWFR
ncbi:MAG: Stp1/IreP family PP2C-type Ser/Thr phosphatase [Candidatus Hydrogenedentes bacterium]|nr:Stp1/IreP family PP2C-type Ser/Thr phosphatase [Candidatus Hydrogenedentota bacterium]